MFTDITPKYIVGSDPSFAHYGLTIIDRVNKTIQTFDIKSTLGRQDFLNMYVKSKEQVQNVLDIIKSVDRDIITSLDTVYGMENALVHSFTATALTALDMRLYETFSSKLTATFNPTYLTFLMGKHKKSDSIALANKLLEIYNEHNYKHTKQASKSLTDGEAESLIYATRMLCRTAKDEKVVQHILEFEPKFKEEKEKYLEDFIY